MTQYQKITEYDVYRLLLGIDLEPMNAGHGISTHNVATILKTSYYQANKYLKALEVKNAVKRIDYQDICCCYEFCECDATNRTYKLWVFANRLEDYREQDMQQELKAKRAWDTFVNS